MSDSTHIQWTDATWSPVTGCTKTSEGCLNCYIDRTPPFRMNHRRFDGPDIGATTGVKLHSDRLGIPLRWRNPRRVFVCSLADLFHDEVPDRFIADVFAVMSLAKQHTFQILTKRHARLRSLLNSGNFWIAVNAARMARGVSVLPGGGPVCLPNAWIGVSVENQRWAEVRIPALLDTPAAVRWLSLEPLLGSVDLSRFLRPGRCSQCGQEWTDRACGPTHAVLAHDKGLSWAVVGGESGPGSRPFDPTWARGLVEQCRAAGVAPFVKQFGSVWARDNGAADRKGGDWDSWPADLRVREYPQPRAAAVAR